MPGQIPMVIELDDGGDVVRHEDPRVASGGLLSHPADAFFRHGRASPTLSFIWRGWRRRRLLGGLGAAGVLGSPGRCRRGSRREGGRACHGRKWDQGAAPPDENKRPEPNATPFRIKGMAPGTPTKAQTRPTTQGPLGGHLGSPDEACDQTGPKRGGY